MSFWNNLYLNDKVVWTVDRALVFSDTLAILFFAHLDQFLELGRGSRTRRETVAKLATAVFAMALAIRK